MNITPCSQDFENIKTYIFSIDFSQLSDKMVQHEGWSRKHVDKVREMYRNFLFLKRKYGELYLLPPSTDIDAFWHYHILDTVKYREDCEVIFGKYLDHYPYFGIDDKSDRSDLLEAFNNMCKLYKEEFGEEIKLVRGPLSQLKSLIYQIINFRF